MTSEKSEFPNFEKLTDDIAEGRLSFFELMQVAKPIFEQKDCEGFIRFSRAYIMLMHESRIQERFLKEFHEEAKRRFPETYDPNAIEQNILARDGFRLLNEVASNKHKTLIEGSPLLTGKTFESCLAQYLQIQKHVESILANAFEQFHAKNFPLCVFLSILTIEETGKIGRLWIDLMNWDLPRNDARTLGKQFRSHHKKHFLAIASGAVINSRLDRILGKENILKLLKDLEKGEVERVRQSCLYMDMANGKVVFPQDVIIEEKAKFFFVLAAEVWAETLGHFPWEFKRMIEKVSEYEMKLGFTKEQIDGRVIPQV